MGAVIGGAIGSVVGGTVGKAETDKAKENMKEILIETTKPPRKLLRMIIGIFGGKKKEDAKKIPHEDVK